MADCLQDSINLHDTYAPSWRHGSISQLSSRSLNLPAGLAQSAREGRGNSGRTRRLRSSNCHWDQTMRPLSAGTAQGKDSKHRDRAAYRGGQDRLGIRANALIDQEARSEELSGIKPCVHCRQERRKEKIQSTEIGPHIEADKIALV